MYQLYITVSKHNFIVNLIKSKKYLISSYNVGKLGYSGSQRSSYVAKTEVLTEICKEIKKRNISNLQVAYRGSFRYKRATFKILTKYNISLAVFQDLTGKPHNGCRLKKKKRK